eukprot:7728762-Pyramimonas_sp.AAC.1
MVSVVRSVTDKSSDEEKAKRKEADTVQEISYLSHISEGSNDEMADARKLHKMALETLFYDYMYETDRQRNYFGSAVKNAFDAANSS